MDDLVERLSGHVLTGEIDARGIAVTAPDPIRAAAAAETDSMRVLPVLALKTMRRRLLLEFMR